MADRLFEALDAEWAVAGNNHHARAALGRWAETEPALVGLSSPAEALRWCRGAEPAAAAAVLGALVRLAGEPLAARTVLQAVVPALRAQVLRRTGGQRCSGGGHGYEVSDDLDADVVEAAVARIAALAGTSPTWPAQAICEATWDCLRAGARRNRRNEATAELGAEAESVAAGPARSEAEDLAVAVADAVRGRWLDAEDARVIYVTRVLGHTPAEVATAVGRDVRAVRAQRRRAERRLERVGVSPPARCGLGGAGAVAAPARAHA